MISGEQVEDLFEAVQNNDIIKLDYMISTGADLNIRSEQEISLLHSAIWSGRLDIIKYLLEKGIDVEAKDKYGNTVMHFAAHSTLPTKIEMIKILLKYDASINEKDIHGSTPMDYLTRGTDQDSEIIELLKSYQEKKDSVKPFTMFFVGEVSSGKSSMLNAVAGGMVCSTSLQRETFSPEIYKFTKRGREESVRKLSDQIETSYRANEAKREKITELDVHDIITPVEKCTNITLPIRHNLDNFQIVDFAGINDVMDRGSSFLEAIQRNIHMCDLMVYISDATRSFQTTSEVQLLNELKTIVMKENRSGHFVDLVIVSNKYDTRDDPDLNAIYSRIEDNAGISCSKTFRCSSHKILIDTIVKNKLEMYSPKFVIRELQKVLQTAKVNISQELKNRLVDTGYISHRDIEYLIDLDDIEIDKTNYIENYMDGQVKKDISPVPVLGSVANRVNGDWDNFFQWLHEFQNSLDIKRLDVLGQYVDIIFDNLLRKLLPHQTGISNQSPFSDPEFFWEDSDEVNKLKQKELSRCFSEIKRLKTLLETDKQLISGIDFRKKIIKLMKLLSRFDSVCVETLAYSLLVYFLDLMPGLVDNFIDNVLDSEKLSTYTQQLVLYDYHKDILVSNKAMKLYVNCLKTPEAWSSNIYGYYDIEDGTIYNGFDVVKGEYSHKSWFVNNLMAETENHLFKMVLILATRKMRTLRAWDKIGMIPYGEIEKFFGRRQILQMQFYIANAKSGLETLENLMFEEDNNLEKYFRETEVVRQLTSIIKN